MSDLKCWWGADEKRGIGIVLVVAKDAADAAKRAGVTPGNFPFQFRPRKGTLPYGVDQAGLYRQVLGGAWVREQRPKPPPERRRAARCGGPGLGREAGRTTPPRPRVGQARHGVEESGGRRAGDVPARVGREGGGVRP